MLLCIDHLINRKSDVESCLESSPVPGDSWKVAWKVAPSRGIRTGGFAQLSKIFRRYNGIKTLSYQLPEKVYERLLARDDTKVIFLSRRNSLQAVVSCFIARQTNVWQRSDLEKGGSHQVAQLEPVPVDQLRETLNYYCELDAA